IPARPAQTEAVQELAEDAGVHALGAADQEAPFVARFSPRSQAAEGASVEAVVDTRTLHFFDPGTGLGIYDTSTGGADPS
ncbi:MAG: ABC transporter ATP-binding protein, partial [Conexibacter sp.]